MTGVETVLEKGPIDLTGVTSTGYSRNADLTELLESLGPVDLQGLEPDPALPARTPEEVGFTNELGWGPEGYRDHVSNVFKIDPTDTTSPSRAVEYISTFGVSEFGSYETSPGPESTKGYVIQLAVNEEYQELFLIPQTRALAEAIHHAAVNSFRSGNPASEVEASVRDLSSRLGVQILE
jgi:hypothetical protein